MTHAEEVDQSAPAATTEEYDDLRGQRLQKLLRLVEQGVDPYPPRFQRTHTAAEARLAFEQGGAGEVSLAGRIVSMRIMGKASFCHVQDGSGRIQLYFRQDVMGDRYQSFRSDLDIADFIGARGTLFQTRTGEVTLQVQEFVLLAKALRPLPEKWHGLTDVETRYRQRYLDLVSNETVRQVFQTRSAIVGAMRCYLNTHGFIEVETPILQPLYGGAAARPFETYHNALDRRLFLRIASELYLKRLIVGGLDRVYEIGKDFRNEGVSTTHNPEFTMMECYQAYADYNDMMVLVEEMLASIAREVLGTLQFPWKGHTIDLTPPWRRVTLREAILEESGIDYDRYPTADALAKRMVEARLTVVRGTPRGKLIDELLDTYVEPKAIQPTFLLDYPVELSPLAKKKPGAPGVVERFEGFVGGIEIANAFSELNDPLDQRERFLQQRADAAAGDDEAHQMDEDFVVALEHGMPPTGGLGVGVDRLAMLFTDQHSIRDVILFPQLRSQG
ncbi:MAG: lysine--tRNA ligase [Chloroflexi bacterium]|nr:lysine--tRNA ligase [Chloroflexota bacterium]